MTISDQVRPIYNELQGYLNQAPPSTTHVTNDKSLWEQFNNCISELNVITGKDYSKFKIINLLLPSQYYTTTRMRVSDYRSKLDGLIMKLYGEYFFDQCSPVNGNTPNTIINQTNQQTVQVSIVLEIQSLIDKKLYGGELEPDEKKFLEKIKGLLSTVKSSTDLINLILTTGTSFGLTLAQISSLFGN